VVLIGDSNAGQFTEPLASAANRAGYDATVATLSSCPFIALQVEGGASSEADCSRFVTGSLAALLAQRPRPSLVVIAARSDLYVEGSAIGLARPGLALSRDEGAKSALWREGLRTILQDLNKAGIPVAIVQPTPVIPGVDAQACGALLILAHRCTASVPRVDADEKLGPVDQAEKQAATALPQTHVLSFENDLCTAQTCSSERRGLPMYRDSNHLSVLGAMTLEPRFLATIESYAKPRRN
jgi:hypothetical protein